MTWYPFFPHYNHHQLGTLASLYLNQDKTLIKRCYINGGLSCSGNQIDKKELFLHRRWKSDVTYMKMYQHMPWTPRLVDYNEEDRDEASEILRASARDVSGSGTSSSTGGVTAARPPPRRTTVKTADRERATNMLKASASSLNDTDGSSGQSSSSSNRPIAKPPSRSATMTSGSRSARPPSRPTGRSRTATSSLKAAAASLD